MTETKLSRSFRLFRFRNDELVLILSGFGDDVFLGIDVSKLLSPNARTLNSSDSLKYINENSRRLSPSDLESMSCGSQDLYLFASPPLLPL